MLQAFLNIWRIKELRNKLIFTLALLAIYRIGFFIPLPAVDQAALQKFAENLSSGALGNVLSFVTMFTGGSLSQSTIFGLGIMPYISASIILQLLATVLPSLQSLKKEGPAGQQKIIEWTRYATVGLCLIQSSIWLGTLRSQHLVSPEYSSGSGFILFLVCGYAGLTAGTVFLMWLGEQIDKYGIGNGASLIITAGILHRMPGAIGEVYRDFSMPGGKGRFGIETVAFLLVSFVFVVAGAIIITQGQRRIPVQQAKHTRGRRVYGGNKTYLPLRVNHGGVMPIIFASALMIFPSMLVGYMAKLAYPAGMSEPAWPVWLAGSVAFLDRNLHERGYLYITLYVGMIYFFAYFWTTVQFQPKEMATQLRDHGSFIPGLRPGPRTAEYLEVVMERITYVGAGFLALIAIIPTIISSWLGVSPNVSNFLGGTGLLITVSVILDMVQRIEANLMMRNYQGFLSTGGSGKGPRIRGAGSMT